MTNINLKNTDTIPGLRSIYFYPTESCNLRCIHCWLRPEHAADKQDYARLNRHNITVSQMETVVKEALGLGLKSVKLTGGEPFVCPEIFDFMDCFSKFDLNLTIETNATLLTTSKIKKLKNYNIRQLSTSLDGSCAKTHDRIRGIPGSFDKTVRAIAGLIENGISPQVIFCLQVLNVQDLEATIQVARDLAVKSFEINPLLLFDSRTTDDSDCKALGLEALLDIGRRVEKIFPRKFPGIHVNLYLPPALKGARTLGGSGLNTCAVFNICGILSNGDVSLCGVGHARSQLVAGNVKHTGIGELWRNGRIFKELRAKIPGELEGVCSRCLFRFHCLGFCRADVLASNNSMTAPLAMCREAFEMGLFPETRILD